MECEIGLLLIAGGLVGLVLSTVSLVITCLSLWGYL